MKKRENYVNALMSSGNAIIAGEYGYIYSNDYALLRLNKKLTPTQAKEYETAFNEIMNNNKGE